MKSLGTKLRELRIEKGLAWSDLAEGLVSPGMVSQIESDKAMPSHKLLQAFAVRLGVPIEYFLSPDYVRVESFEKIEEAKLDIEKFCQLIFGKEIKTFDKTGIIVLTSDKNAVIEWIEKEKSIFVGFQVKIVSTKIGLIEKHDFLFSDYIGESISVRFPMNKVEYNEEKLLPIGQKIKQYIGLWK